MLPGHSSIGGLEFSEVPLRNYGQGYRMIIRFSDFRCLKYVEELK